MEELQGFWGKCFSGSQILIKECNIVIEQPTIKQILTVGEDEFLYITQFIGKLEQFIEPIKRGNSQLKELSDFQILLIIINQEKEIKKQFLNFLNLICPDYNIAINNNEIVFKQDEQVKGMINNFNFDQFKYCVKKLFIPIQEGEEEIQYNPANEKAIEIAEKIKKGRAKVAEIKNSSGKSLFGIYCSILSIGLGIDLHVILNYTPFQLFDSFNRYIKKIAFDQYQKIATTPFMDVSKIEEPENWLNYFYN